MVRWCSALYEKFRKMSVVYEKSLGTLEVSLVSVTCMDACFPFRGPRAFHIADMFAPLVLPCRMYLWL